MGLFDGMTGLLADVFGGPVILRPRSGPDVVVRGIFRESPVVAASEDGHGVLAIAPNLQLAAADAARVVSGPAGHRISPDGGVRWFLPVARQISGSPASDGFVIFDLEAVGAE